MTKPRDPDALLAAYLTVGMEVLPERVVDSILDEVHRTRQRAVLRPWRTRPTFRSAFSAAAVIAVLVIGGAFFMLTGGPSPTPSADPSPSLPIIVAPSLTPSATAPNPTALPQTTGAWIATGSMGTPRSGHTSVRLLDGRVLVVGGANGDENDTSAELYDPVSGTWSATGNMLKPRGGFFPATLLRDGRVLVGDVDDPDADDPIAGAEVYDPDSGNWTATGKMVAGGALDTATLLRDGTVLARGNGGSELYDPDSGNWTATRSQPGQRHSHAAILLPDGMVLVAGGHVEGDTVTGSAELYDPATGSWTATASMDPPLYPITATLLVDGTVLVVGPGSPSMAAQVYDPATKSWTATGDLARPGASYELITTLTDGTVLVTGKVGAGPDHPAAELYDPGTGSWTTTGTMLRPHDGAPATLLLDGTVLVAGGGIAGDSTELYVPAGVTPPGLPASPAPTDPSAFPQLTGAWIATGSMKTPRVDHTAVRLLDGRVLVAGGSNEAEEHMTSAELYDPQSGTWSATADMLKPSYGVPATLLRDGRVLVGDDETRTLRTGTSARRCMTQPAGPGPPPER